MADIVGIKLEPSLKPPHDTCKEIPFGTKIIRKVMCDNQGLIAQHSYLASERHKAIKTELNNPTGVDKVKLKELCYNLQHFLNTGIENACKVNAGHLQEYFSRRSGKFRPRICIKINDSTSRVIDYFRDRDKKNRTYIGTDTLIESNTGFEHVYQTGSSYSCPNIPKEVKESGYKNPRLIPAKAGSFKTNLLREKYIHLFSKKDDEWIKCWKTTADSDNVPKTPRPEECYKSTMIIPMTLVNNTLDHEFKRQFRIDTEQPGRSIYGYLCFDSHYINFFDSIEDDDIGYIFADILSLYFITNLIYTDYSKTFKDAREVAGL